MTKAPNFDYIGQYPQHIPTIAQWHQDQWQHISPHLTTSLRIKEYSAYANGPAIPSCILAFIDNQPAGSASLVTSDMETRPDLSPWLASVFVSPQFRGHGIATQLIEKCLSDARQLNIKSVYLFTTDQMHFYQRRGWKLLESTTYHGENVDIMSYDLKLFFK